MNTEFEVKWHFHVNWSYVGFGQQIDFLHKIEKFIQKIWIENRLDGIFKNVSLLFSPFVEIALEVQCPLGEIQI